jgi:hypothetical protein
MPVAVASLDDLHLNHRHLKVGPRTFKADQDSSLVVLLTAASWVLQRLPGRVVKKQRAEVIRALAQSQNLIVMIQCGQAPTVLIFDGERLLVKIPAR